MQEARAHRRSVRHCMLGALGCRPQASALTRRTGRRLCKHRNVSTAPTQGWRPSGSPSFFPCAHKSPSTRASGKTRTSSLHTLRDLGLSVNLSWACGGVPAPPVFSTPVARNQELQSDGQREEMRGGGVPPARLRSLYPPPHPCPDLLTAVLWGQNPQKHVIDSPLDLGPRSSERMPG